MRRLPVIQQTDTDDAAAASRPRWQWCLIGAGLASTMWMPLAVLTAPLGMLPLIVCFGISAAAAGALVGRFGGQAGKREAGISGVIAAFGVTCLAGLGGAGLSPSGLVTVALVLAVVGAVAGFAGGHFGVKRRHVLGSRR
jgi:tRNA-(ms[2]io[6]A)-hydroxylase